MNFTYRCQYKSVLLRSAAAAAGPSTITTPTRASTETHRPPSRHLQRRSPRYHVPDPRAPSHGPQPPAMHSARRARIRLPRDVRGRCTCRFRPRLSARGPRDARRMGDFAADSIGV
ncbi:hypothetical protein B0H19DRAFT_653759 [Mycena capillaripes]|nr:hypothetical protein B0H19DRAFT_653759 [Mycena capillaripes]